MIPEDKNEAVVRALRQAFDVDHFEDITMLTGGLTTALVFRIVVRGRPYLLRLITRTDAMNDPTRQFTCMASGAEAGLAPRIWYTSIEDRLSITDFVEVQPFSRSEALARLPLTIRSLHSLPPFPRPINYLDAMDGIVQRFRAAKILPESDTAELFQFYAKVFEVYSRQESELVSCHNDLKPENILFDGDRVWLVDWEAAFVNDRYLDLAVVANFIVTSDAEEEAYLRAYFGEAAGEYRLARFYLMSQLLHVFYGVVFMQLGSSGQPVESNAQVPDFRSFHDAIWRGEMSFADNDTRLLYGRVHLKQFLLNMAAVRFQDALQIVAERPAIV